MDKISKTENHVNSHKYFYKGLYFLLQRTMDERETHYSFEHNNLPRNTQNIIYLIFFLNFFTICIIL